MLDWLSVEAQNVSSAGALRLETTGIVTQGIMAGTRVASNLGWRPVEALTAGDKVLTFDNGMQTLAEVRREVLWLDATHVPEQHWPVTVPAGALCNRAALTVMPDQGVMVESDVADDAVEDPFAVIAARQLVGLRGITRTPPRRQVEVVTLIFSEAQVIYAEGGALLHCPFETDLLSGITGTPNGRYPVLSAELSALVVDELRMEDAFAARDAVTLAA